MALLDQGYWSPYVVFFFSKGHCETMLDVTKNTLVPFKRICMNFFTGIERNYFKSPSDL